MTTPAKSKALRDSGTLNPHPEAVRSELFQMDFFDPYDLAQVKYEMLRAHSVDEDPVAEVCRQFGLSRESFYQIERAFHELGFCAFLPRKRGRKGPVKLRGEVLEFAVAQGIAPAGPGVKSLACSPQPCLDLQDYTIWVSGVTVADGIVRMNVTFRNSSTATHASPEDLQLVDASNQRSAAIQDASHPRGGTLGGNR